MTTPYDRSFYTAQAPGSKRSAEIVLPLIMARHSAKSVADVGCGTGTWLRAAMDLGVQEIQGFDGKYVDQTQLKIPSTSFTPVDLTHPLVVSRRYDLALCLEVGEHLPDESARMLVSSLVALSDVVLFSAAVPGQGGTNHINEQWPEYWAEHFRTFNFRALDCVRASVWRNPEVDWWYAQNIILFASENAIQRNPKLAEGQPADGIAPLPLLHPQALEGPRKTLSQIRNNTWGFGLRWSLGACVHALLSKLQADRENRR